MFGIRLISAESIILKYLPKKVQHAMTLTTTEVCVRGGVVEGGWRCAYKEGGVVCVNGVGTTRMPLLCADSWAILQQVCDLEN